MDITTRFNMDEVFYSVEGRVRVFTINNIMTSAVGHKTIYELKDATTNSSKTMTERELVQAVDEKRFVKTIDEVRTYLANRAEEIVASAELAKTNFLKTKLNKTLHGNQRKAIATIESMKKKLGLDDESESESESENIYETVDDFFEYEDEGEKTPGIGISTKNIFDRNSAPWIGNNK